MAYTADSNDVHLLTNHANAPRRNYLALSILKANTLSLHTMLIELAYFPLYSSEAVEQECYHKRLASKALR